MAALAAVVRHRTRPARGASADVRLRRLRVFCLAVPVAVLVAACVWLAITHGTVRLWNVVVHESGRYTLGETIFYFAHFLREIPTLIAYVLFLLAISGGAARPAIFGLGARTTGWVALIGAVAVVTWALVATARADGWSSALLDLMQYRTRDDLQQYGSHWRFHWLSTLWFGAATALAPAVIRKYTGRAVLLPHRSWLIAAWSWFVALSIIFGVSGDIFFDARYAGHQAREIMTHAPVTGLLGVGVLLMWQRRRQPIAPADAAHAEPVGQTTRRPRELRASYPAALVVAWTLVALLVPVYLAIVALSGDAMAQGQAQQGLGGMVAAHYVEHSLDYVTVFLLLVAGLAPADLPSHYERDDAASDGST